MRPGPWLALLLLLPGCADDAPPAAAAPAPEAPRETAAPNATVGPPELRVGQSWTYRTQGAWDATEEVTVVVAEASAEGYLFAAADRDDLVDEVTWDRFFFGRTDRSLQQLDAEGRPRPHQRLRFPLEDGASWSFRDMTLTARAGKVATPAGPVDGFLVRGEREGYRMELDYAPSLGAVTHYAGYGPDGTLEDSLDLAATGTAASWAWFERGAEVFFSPPYQDPSQAAGYLPQTLEVREGDDTVVAWAIGFPGSRAALAPPPPAAPWTFEGRGNREYQLTLFDAVPGTWTAAGVPGGPDGWIYLQAHAIRWTTGP